MSLYSSPFIPPLLVSKLTDHVWIIKELIARVAV
jgi:hypothetical protein